MYEKNRIESEDYKKMVDENTNVTQDEVQVENDVNPSITETAQKKIEYQERSTNENDEITEKKEIQEVSETDIQNDIKSSKNDEKSESEKKEKPKDKKRPEVVSLKDKSERFKALVDIALEIEKLEDDRIKLKGKNDILAEDNKRLFENLKDSEELSAKRLNEITELKNDLEKSREVVGIVKADKTESLQEFKNALAASLKTFYGDYNELKNMEMSGDVAVAMSDTLEDVFNILAKNGIIMEN